MGTPQKRKFRRFNLEYLVHVRFPSGNAMAEVDAVTRNISLRGLLVESACLIPYRSPVEFSITLRGGPISRSIELTGAGKVVRVEPGKTADGFGIAVACSHPLDSNLGP
jgi:PilZ domain